MADVEIVKKGYLKYFIRSSSNVSMSWERLIRVRCVGMLLLVCLGYDEIMLRNPFVTVHNSMIVLALHFTSCFLALHSGQTIMVCVQNW